jgi:hypothetical protein
MGQQQATRYGQVLEVHARPVTMVIRLSNMTIWQIVG